MRQLFTRLVRWLLRPRRLAHAAAHGKDATTTVDNAGGSPIDITAYVFDVAGLPGTAAADDDTTMGSADESSTPGLMAAVVTIQLRKLDATILAIGNAWRGAQKTVVHSPDGGTTTYTAEVNGTGFVLSANVSSVVAATMTGKITGAVVVS